MKEKRLVYILLLLLIISINLTWVKGQILENKENNQYDFLASVRNLNEEWAVYFDYTFSYGSLRTEKKRGFILPNSLNYLMELGHESEVVVKNAKINISNLTYQYNKNKTRQI